MFSSRQKLLGKTPGGLPDAFREIGIRAAKATCLSPPPGWGRSTGFGAYSEPEMTTRQIRRSIFRSPEARIALLAVAAIALHLLLRYALPWGSAPVAGSLRIFDLPLLVGLALGGAPLVWTLLRQALRREFGSDLLAGISIVTAILLGEYLAGTLVVLMLSGGQALEAFAVRSASSVLEALARRMPSLAHCRKGGQVVDVALGEVAVGQTLVVFPHETCPVDGTVVEGHG